MASKGFSGLLTMVKKKMRRALAMFNARPLKQKLKKMIPLERSLKNLSFEWSHNILVSFVLEH